MSARVDEAEKAVKRLAEQRKKMEKAMAAEDFYSDKAVVAQTQVAYGQLLRDLEEEETAWLETQEAFERA